MKKRALLVIFLTVFIDLIGFGIVLPLLPKYAERFGAEGLMIGLIIASFSIMQFIFAPAWGKLSDRIGRRPVLLISTAGSTISYALFAIASYSTDTKALALLLFSRIFAGICGANLSVASAYIADVTDRENRSKSMGLIGMAFGLGFIFGPAIGALGASHFGLAGPGWIASAFCAANFILACFILQESRQPSTAATSVPSRPRLGQWLHTIRQPKLGALIGIYFLATFCFACFESTLPLMVGSSALHRDDLRSATDVATRLKQGLDPVSQYLLSQASPQTFQLLHEYQPGAPVSSPLKERLLVELNKQLESSDLYDSHRFSSISLRDETKGFVSAARSRQNLPHFNRLLLEDAYPQGIQRKGVYYDERQIGYLFAYCGLIAAFIQGGAIGKLIKKFGDQRLIAGSLLIVAISLLLIPYLHGLAGILLSLGLFAAGSGINRAPTMGQISLNSPADEQGVTLGIAQSAGTLARIFGPIFATTLYAVHRPIPYLVTAGVAFVAGLLAWRMLCRGEETSPVPPLELGKKSTPRTAA